MAGKTNGPDGRGGRVWKAASYARLSVESGDEGQSASITTQQRIIETWAGEHDDVTVVESFVDDGYSGSNLDRPGFRAMMAAVDEGRVDCVVVKDYSRLARNYLQAGRYMEEVFPSKGVRFISVSDGYDGLELVESRADDIGAGLNDVALLAPIKNMMNDYYCATTSAKIKAALAVRRADGLYVGSLAPYGYLKDPADRNVLVADPVAAPVVARIFQMRASGKSFVDIARALEEEGVAPPSELRRMRARESGEPSRGDSGGPARWHASTVGNILKERTYTGTLVQGRTFKPSFRQRTKLKRAPEMQSYSPGACPAIVSEELFELVQRLNASALTGGGRRSENPLRGMVFCGVCGKRMNLSGAAAEGKRYAYYRCTGGCRPRAHAEKVMAAVEGQAGSVDRATLILRGARVEVVPVDSVTVSFADDPGAPLPQ